VADVGDPVPPADAAVQVVVKAEARRAFVVAEAAQCREHERVDEAAQMSDDPEVYWAAEALGSRPDK
jgi:hypothetical protein